MSFWEKVIGLFDSPIKNNPVDKSIIHNLPVMDEEAEAADPDDLSLENAYKTRWIWYHTILAVLIFFTNLILFGIFVLLAIKL
jgi:hypothetical protein